MLSKKTIIKFLVLSTLSLFSQKGPGGVGDIDGTDMYLWLRPEVGLTTTATGVSAWADQSGYKHDGTSTYSLEQSDTDQQPAYGINQINGFDVVTFDGDDTGDAANRLGDYLQFDIDDITDDTYDLYFVWKRTDDQEVNSALFSSGNDFTEPGTFQLSHKTVTSTSFVLSTLEGGSEVNWSVGATSKVVLNNILEINKEGSLANRVIHVDGDSDTGSKTYDVETPNPASVFTDFIFGTNRERSKFLEMDLAEVIIYNRKLNDAERVIVNNYLSAKYDIASTSSSTYNEDDVVGNYDYDVVGIGQASDGSNNTSAEGTGVLGFNSPAGLDNNEYLFAGNDNVSLDIDEAGDVPAGVESRLSRVWRVSEQGDVGVVTLTMDLSFSVNKLSFTTSNLRLLVSDDAEDFLGSSTEYTPVSYSTTTGIAVFENLDLNNHDHITIANTDPSLTFGGSTSDDIGVAGYEGPGGIGAVDGSAMYFWLRPDAGVTATTEITNWEDQSGYLHNGVDTFSLTPNTTNPEFGTNNMNGYDVITFDGVTDALVFDNDDFDDKDFNLFFVWKRIEGVETNSSLFSNSASSSRGGSFQLSHGGNTAMEFSIKAQGEGTIKAVETTLTTNNNILELNRKASAKLDVRVDGVFELENYAFTASNPSNSMDEIEDIRFGVDRNTSAFLGMDLAEVVMFTNNLNDTQRIILQNYLGAKYDITVSDDKYAHDGSGFDHHLAGIGAETTTDAHTDAKGTGPVRVNNASSLDSGDYLLWAASEINSVFNFDATPVPSFEERLSTKWRIDETGDVGTVDVSFTASELNITTTVSDSCVNYVLLIDNNEDFSSPEQQILMTLTDGVISASGVDFSDGDYFTLEIANTIVYNSTWNHPLVSRLGTSTPNIADDCFDVRVVSGSVVIDNDVDVNSIDVSNSAVLAMNTARTLKVYNNINLNTSGKLKLLGTSQMLQDPDGLLSTNPNSGAGFYNEFTTPAKDIYSYSYISPSTSNGSTYNFTTNFKDGRGTNALSLTNDGADFVFDSGHDGEQTASKTTLSTFWMYSYPSDALGFVAQGSSGNVATGLGILSKEPGTLAQTYISTGIPNAGEYIFNLEENSVGLLGNPYPSALNSNLFLGDNPEVDALYFYEDQTTSTGHHVDEYDGGYAVYTSSGGGVAASTSAYDESAFSGTITPDINIPVGQGFFVSMEEDIAGTTSADVTFKNSQRVSAVLGNSSVFFKQKKLKTFVEDKKEIPSIRLGFEVDLGEGKFYHRQIGLSFNSGNKIEEFNHGYDALLFDEKEKDMFIEAGDKKYVLGSATTISENLNIPIKVVLDEDKEVSFMLDNIQNIEEIYLKDKVENTVEPLKGNVIKRNLVSGTYTDRFLLTFKKDETLPTKEIKGDNTDFNIENSKGLVTVTSDRYEVRSLRVVDMTGKIIKESTKNTIDCSNVVSKIMILKIETNKGDYVKKIVL